MTASELRMLDWFTEPSLVGDPVPFYEAVRQQGPIWREPNRGTFLVTGYDETAAVYRDLETFSSCPTRSPDRFPLSRTHRTETT